MKKKKEAKFLARISRESENWVFWLETIFPFFSHLLFPNFSIHPKYPKSYDRYLVDKGCIVRGNGFKTREVSDIVLNAFEE